MSESPPVLLARLDDGVARLTLAGPERRNAINPAAVEAFAAAIESCRLDPPRALLIDAEGAAFTVGGDLDHFAAHCGDGAALVAALERMVPTYHRSLLALAELPCPSVCAINGAAAGGGIGIAVACDLRIGVPETVFATGFCGLGLSGDGGLSWWLPRLIGHSRAAEMLLGGRVVGADEALAWGLLGRIVATERLGDEAIASARRFAAGPGHALGEMRRLLLASSTATLAEQLVAESEALSRSAADPDARAGVLAFARGQRPKFRR